MTKRQPVKPPTGGARTIAKTTRARSTASTTQTTVGNVAAFVGKTMADLLNRKDALQTQLAQVESQLADARTRVGRTLKEYVPDSLPGLGRQAKKSAAPRRKTTPRRTPTPPAAHGPDRESTEAAVATRAASGAKGETRPVRPRTAPRATRRG